MDIEGIFRILGGLVPEPTNDPMKLYHWNKRVGLALMFLLLTGAVVAFATATAYGLLPSYGPGFVRKDTLADMQAIFKKETDAKILAQHEELEQNTNERKKYWATQLDANILDARTKQCGSRTTEGKRLYAAQIDRLLDQYADTKGIPYHQLPLCSDLQTGKQDD